MIRETKTLFIAILLAGCSNPDQGGHLECVIMRDDPISEFCTGREYMFDISSDTANVDNWVPATTGVGLIEVRRKEGIRTYYLKSEQPGEGDVIVFGSPEYGRKEVCRRHFTFSECDSAADKVIDYQK